ncbi:hypothetical protein PIB30_091193 [Stylosanthes scabra]|uniref:Uncharacterized protein n=1 Tax=Stylosanthes scabra TaxID=79078 RepID=A0ABU6WSV8_9FABA|nr:hypothetical protein [Stylosanthes scabra]
MPRINSTRFDFLRVRLCDDMNRFATPTSRFTASILGSSRPASVLGLTLTRRNHFYAYRKPVERWFAEDDEISAYDERLSRMEILPPKYIGDGVLLDEKYSEFWRLIDIQGLRPFLYTRGRYYPRFVAAASTTIFIRENEDEGEEFTLGFRLGGREFKFTLDALAAAWGLRNEGDTFKGGNYPLGTWNEFSKATAMREPRLEQAVPGKYAVSRISTDHRLLLYVLSYVLLPRKSNHGTATEEDLLILWAIVNEKQIHWPYLMANRLFRYSQGRATSFLGLAHLWIGLFEIAQLDLSREEVVNPGSANIITSKNINQMRRNLVDQADAAEGVGEDAAGDMPMPDTQPQPTVGTSSQVPTETEEPSQEQLEVIEFMRNGFEGMRVMLSDMFTGLSDRIDGLEAHMTSQDADIRGLRDELRSLKGEDVTMDPPEQQDDAPAQD